jgi:hypothetical protein
VIERDGVNPVQASVTMPSETSYVFDVVPGE